MVYKKISNYLLAGSSSDSKPTTYTINTLFFETDTTDLYIYAGSSVWNKYAGPDKTETLTNKTLSTASNTLTSGSAATGDLLHYSGSKFDRLGMGSTGQVLTSGASDISWAPPTFPIAGYQTSPDNGMWGASIADGSIDFTPYGQGARFGTPTGTAKFDLIASEGIYLTMSSGGVTNTKVGILDNLGSAAFCMDMNPYLKARVRFNGAGSVSRVMLGFSGGSAVPTSDTLVASSSPAVLIGCRTTDSNYFAVTNDNSGAATYTNTGVAYSTTGFHTFEVQMLSTGSAVFTIDGTVTNTISTNVPTTGIGMHLHCYYESSSTTAVTADWKYYMFRTSF